MAQDSRRQQEAAAAWDVVARAKYSHEFDSHVALLKAGGHNLLPDELEMVSAILPGADVVQLQCSHGLDALGLLNAGARSVVGIDISSEMIEQARAKAAAVGAAQATFICSDILAPSPSLDGAADLVYTGRGSLPWVEDLRKWGETIRRMLRPDGHLFVFEGHPLTHLWNREVDSPELRPGVGYFDETPTEAPGFPAAVVQRALGDDRPRMLERHWRLGEVVEALATSGMQVIRLRESPTLFWNQFPKWSDEMRNRLPNSYAILARIT